MNTDPMVVRDVFASHYFLLAFLASLGTMQVAVTISGARGLWLTPYRAMTRWLGIALIVTGFLIFFAQPLWIEGPWAAGSVEADSVSREWGQADWADLAGARNVNDIHGGLDGTRQAIWFPLAAVLAFATSALAGALNLRVFKRVEGPAVQPGQDDSDADGLAGLAGRSYFSNLPVSWRKFRSEVAGVWRTGLASADRWSVFKVILGRSPE
ncbi:MAG: hypothetical protein J4O07_10420 [Chloroflexi bacterium]|nr:hypothetical protein [Chloroflexota bacterium]